MEQLQQLASFVRMATHDLAATRAHNANVRFAKIKLYVRVRNERQLPAFCVDRHERPIADLGAFNG